MLVGSRVRLTPSSTVLLEKLTVPQTVNELPTIYGTRRLITVFKTACQFSLSCARLIQSTSPPIIFI